MLRWTPKGTAFVDIRDHHKNRTNLLMRTRMGLLRVPTLESNGLPGHLIRLHAV